MFNFIFALYLPLVLIFILIILSLPAVIIFISCLFLWNKFKERTSKLFGINTNNSLMYVIPVTLSLILFILFYNSNIISTVFNFYTDKTSNGFYGERFYKVVNQKNELKEIYDEKDVVSGRQFSLQIIGKGFAKNKFTKDINDFLENEGINGGKTSFVAQHCYIEFKITNLQTQSFRVDGRSIKATKTDRKSVV